jgi:hypothetical protein
VLTLRLSVIALLLALPMSLAFQTEKADDKNPVVKTRPPLPKYFSKIGLRDDQKTAVTKIQLDFRDKIDELKQKMAKLKAEEDAALEKVLTADQVKRLGELRSGKKTVEPEKTKTDPEKTKTDK